MDRAHRRLPHRSGPALMSATARPLLDRVNAVLVSRVLASPSLFPPPLKREREKERKREREKERKREREKERKREREKERKREREKERKREREKERKRKRETERECV